MTSTRNLYSNLMTFYNQFYYKCQLQNPFFCLTNNGRVLTWSSYQPKPGFYTYEEYYSWVNSNNQYSLAIENKALIQIYYESSGTDIVKASLSFLPHPESLMGYFRFDMDKNRAVNFTHNSYHINFGYRTDDVRFSLQKFPFPSEFIKFTLFLCGFPDFQEYSGDKFFPDLLSLKELYNHCFDFTVV